MSILHTDFLLLLRKYKLLFAGIFIFMTIAGGLVLKKRVLKYSGTTYFYIANDRLVNPSHNAQDFNKAGIPLVSIEHKVVEQLIYSTQMMEFLVNAFKLYNHYGIDTTQRFHFERTVNLLRYNIAFDKSAKDLFSVTVKDRNNEIAAAMANSIVYRLEIFNKQYLRNKINANLKLYNAFVSESNKQSMEQNARLQELIQNLRNAESINGNQQNNDMQFADVALPIYEAVSRISEITVQNLNSQSFLLNSIQMIENDNMPSVIISRRALPELQSKVRYLVLAALGSGVVGVIFTMSIMYFYHSMKDDLAIVFGNKDRPSSNP